MCCFHLQRASALLKTYHRENITCHQALNLALDSAFFLAFNIAKRKYSNCLRKKSTQYLKVKQTGACLSHGLELYLHLFLTSARDGTRWPASRLVCCIHGERLPATHSVWTWVGHTGDVDNIVKRKTRFKNCSTVHCVVIVLIELTRIVSFT